MNLPKNIKKMIKLTDSSTKYALSCFRFKQADGKFSIAATNGRAGIIRTWENDDVDDESLLDAKQVSKAVGTGKGTVVFRDDSITDGGAKTTLEQNTNRFPDLDQAFPDLEGSTKVSFDAKLLRDICDILVSGEIEGGLNRINLFIPQDPTKATTIKCINGDESTSAVAIMPVAIEE